MEGEGEGTERTLRKGGLLATHTYVLECEELSSYFNSPVRCSTSPCLLGIQMDHDYVPDDPQTCREILSQAAPVSRPVGRVESTEVEMSPLFLCYQSPTTLHRVPGGCVRATVRIGCQGSWWVDGPVLLHPSRSPGLLVLFVCPPLPFLG